MAMESCQLTDHKREGTPAQVWVGNPGAWHNSEVPHLGEAVQHHSPTPRCVGTSDQPAVNGQGEGGIRKWSA